MVQFHHIGMKVQVKKESITQLQKMAESLYQLLPGYLVRVSYIALRQWPVAR